MVTYESSPVGSSRRNSASQRNSGHSTTTISHHAEASSLTHRVGTSTVRNPPGHNFSTYTDPSQRGGFVEDMRTVMYNHHQQDGRTSFRAIGGHPPTRGGLQHGGKSPTKGRKGRPESASMPDGHVSGFKGNVIRGAMMGRKAQQQQQSLQQSGDPAQQNSSNNIGPYWAAYVTPPPMRKLPQRAHRPGSAELLAAMSRKGGPPKSPSTDKKKSSTAPGPEAATQAEPPSENEGTASVSKETPTEQAVDEEATQSDPPVENEGSAGMSKDITLDQVMDEAAAEDGPALENEGSVGMLKETPLDQEMETVPRPSMQPEDPSGGVEASLEDVSEGSAGLPLETNETRPEDEATASEKGSGSVAVGEPAGEGGPSPGAKEIGEEAQVAVDEGEKEAEGGDVEGEGQIQAVRDLLEESGLRDGREGRAWGVEAEISIKEIGSTSAMSTTSRTSQMQRASEPIPSATRRVVSSEPNTRPGTAQEPYRPAQSARPQPVFSSTVHPGRRKGKNKSGRLSQSLIQTAPSTRTSHGFVTSRRPAWEAGGLALAPYSISPRRQIPFRTTTILSDVWEGSLAHEPALVYQGGRMVHSARPWPKRPNAKPKELLVSGNSVMSQQAYGSPDSDTMRATNAGMSARKGKKKNILASPRGSSAGFDKLTAAGTAEFKVISVGVTSSAPATPSKSFAPPSSKPYEPAKLRVSPGSPQSPMPNTPTPWTPSTPNQVYGASLSGGLSPILAAGPIVRQIGRN